MKRLFTLITSIVLATKPLFISPQTEVSFRII